MEEPLEELEKELSGKKKSIRIGKYRIPLRKETPEKDETPEKEEASVEVKMGKGLTIPKKYFDFSSLLNWLLYFSLFLFFALLIFFIYRIYFGVEGVGGLNISLTGPNEVNSLENYSYTLRIENSSNQKLINSSLKIALSNGAFFKDYPKEKEISLSIGDLEPKKVYEEKLNLVFVNEGEQREKINILMNYQLPMRTHTFEKSSEFLVFVKNPPLKVQAFIPTKIYVNQQFQSSFFIINLTQSKLQDITVSIDPPSDFLLTSSFPQSEKFYFELGSLEPNEKKEISFVGQIQKVSSSGLIQVKTSFSWEDFSFSLPKETFKIALLENPVVLNIQSNPQGKSLPIGSSIFYEINLENRSQAILKDNEVRVIFDGPFDSSSLNSDGYFDQLENVLYWNTRNKSELLNLKPGDKLRLTFSVSLLRSYPILSDSQKNFSLKIRVEFRTPSIPPEVEIGGKEYLVFQEDEKKIMGSLIVDQELEGPLSLTPNIPQNLSWHIKIKSIGEDFDNFTLNTKLPFGVNLTGNVGGDALLENLKFDPKTGAFLYTLNKLPANLGYTQKELDLVFQITVIPPANVDIKNFLIIPPLQYSAIGSFSQAQISNLTRELTSSMIR